MSPITHTPEKTSALSRHLSRSDWWRKLACLPLIITLFSTSTQALSAVTPPMTVVPSVDVNETDQAGYRGGSISSMAI
ncbi:MAG TPA: hypothetical protein PLN94_17905, partial [Thiolinea sp.]|nr:hypothetical protein [Thiolinea sp.]